MNLPDCPIPTQKYDRIVMAHGGGGRMTSRLIEKIFYPAFQNKWLEQAHDGATLNLPSARIAITTDSFVVDPLFFPGGNIGDLAINGTVNDLLCCGATPLYLSAGFILEEGLQVARTRWRLTSMPSATVAATAPTPAAVFAMALGGMVFFMRCLPCKIEQHGWSCLLLFGSLHCRQWASGAGR